MRIRFIRTAPTTATSAAVIGPTGQVAKHPLVKTLPVGDQQYLRTVARTLDGKTELLRLFTLPSGRKFFVLQRGEKPWTLRRAILAARRIVRAALLEKIASLAVHFDDFIPSGTADVAAVAEMLGTQFEMAQLDFNTYRTKPREGWPSVRDIFVVSRGPTARPTERRQSFGQARVDRALRRGKIVGEEINKARALSNTPGGDMTPARLAAAAVKAGRAAGFRVRVFDERRMRTLKMGGILGVAKGSAEKPRFIVMEYLKGPKREKPVVLVGKGITFDTGGLNLKPSDSLADMHMDMSGGAAVIHVIAALARLKIKVNVVGLVPAAENMPSGSSYRPGDLLRTMSGKTVEVMNTDAEGRVILADALTYATKFYEPKLVVDVATLTGAAMAALGQRASALFATDPKLEAAFREAGEVTGDYVWPLPLWEEYEEEVKGTFGDVANIGKTKYGGAITGAVFLWQFVKDIPWVHLDIAPRTTTIESDQLAKGAAGAAIALLVRYLMGNH